MRRDRPWLAYAFGLLFGSGLALSGMTDPARVRGFLDVTRQWDPSLAFVMGGAILTAAPLFAVARRRNGGTDPGPGQGRVDWRLAGGSALFGVGWGATGICPGPAFVNVAASPASMVLLLVMMLVGLLAVDRATQRGVTDDVGVKEPQRI